MIYLYDKWNTAFDTNGTCVLTPLSGSIKMVAGGSYELDLVHPIDERGKWKKLEEEAIIRAPVPKETINASHSGVDCDIYWTTAKTPMRSGTQEPVPVSYNNWSQNTTYYAGAKVKYDSRNWQCKQWDGTSYLSTVPPGPNHPWWVQISGESTPGSPIIVNLKKNQYLFYVSGPSSGWYKFETFAGIQGYVKASDVEFLYHWSASQNPKRTITSQLFRIKTVDIDTDAQQVSVHAVHVSYDLNGVIVNDVNIKKKYAPMALAIIEDGFMNLYDGDIYTDLPTGSGKKYTGSINGKSGMYALLDPDNGIVPTFRAEFRRDNWDLFVMTRATHDKGYYITYGNNMRGVQWHKSTEGLITQIVPVAKKANGDPLYLSDDTVDSTHIDDYPVVYTEWMKVQGQVGKDDGSESGTDWTTSTLRAEMQQQAQDRFDVDKCDEPTYEITITFEMLGDTAEYSYLKKLQTVLLYDKIRVRDTRTNQSATVIVQELEYDIVKEKVIAVKLSNVKRYNSMKNVSGFNMLNNSITLKKLTSDAVNGINDEVKAWVEDNFKTK